MQLLEMKDLMNIMLGVKWSEQYPGQVMRVLVNNDDVNQNIILIEFHSKKTFHC